MQVSDLKCPFNDDSQLCQLSNETLQSGDVIEAYLKAFLTIKNQERQFPPELDLRMATGEYQITENGILQYRERTWLPNLEPLTTTIIQKIHDLFLSGHSGRDTTIALVTRRFFWPGCNQDVRRFVKNCDTYGRSTIWRDKKRGLLKPLPVPSQIWQEISMDFITGLPHSGPEKCTVLLVIIDRLSKGVILIPVAPNRFDTEGLAKIFIKFYLPHHWIPRAIVSDRGSQFVNGFWKTVCDKLKISHRLSTAYHPEIDGQTERANQEVETYVRKFVTYEQNDWTQWIPLAQIAINNKPATSTKISPFFMIHGYNAENITVETNDKHPRRTTASRGQEVVKKLKEAHEFAQASMAVAQQVQEKYSNNKEYVSISYKVGDKVWLNIKNINSDRPCKILNWIHGKYTITKTFPNSAHFYELDTPKGTHNRFHTSLLRPVNKNPLPTQQTDEVQPQGLLTGDGDVEFGIEEILKSREKSVGRGCRQEVLVKWTGYATPWHPLTDFKDTLALDIFEAKRGKIEQNKSKQVKKK